MASLLSMPDELYELALRRLELGDYVGGTHLLRRLLELPDIPPALAAEANFLLAQAFFQTADYSATREQLCKALRRDPSHSDAHFLLARVYELDENGAQQQAMTHYRRAHELAPDDPHKASTYGRYLVQQSAIGQGLVLLQSAYQKAGSDAEIVENFVEGLLAAGRRSDAELVLAQALYRSPTDQRLRALRWQIENPDARRALGIGIVGTDGACDVLQYRNLALEPRFNHRPAAPKRREASGAGPRGWRMAPVRLRRADRLALVLKTLGQCYVRRLHQALGLPDRAGSDPLAAITDLLLSPRRLSALVRGLPKESRRVLRTIVKLGGTVPASVLCQNAGPDAPPPDYLQPLASYGLIYFSSVPASKTTPPQLAVVIPRDLCHCLAKSLRVRSA